MKAAPIKLVPLLCDVSFPLGSQHSLQALMAAETDDKIPCWCQQHQQGGVGAGCANNNHHVRTNDKIHALPRTNDIMNQCQELMAGAKMATEYACARYSKF